MNAIYDLGPDLDPRDEALIYLLHAAHAIRPHYIIGNAGMAPVALRHGAEFQAVQHVLCGHVARKYWDGSTLSDAWAEIADDHMRAGIRAIVQRYYGTGDEAAKAGLEAFDHWCGYWRRVLEATQAELIYSYASPHCVYSYALHVAGKIVGTRIVILRQTSVPDVAFLTDQIYCGLDCGMADVQGPQDDRPMIRVRAHVQRLTGVYADAAPGFMEGPSRDTAPPELRLLRRALGYLARGGPRPTVHPEGARSFVGIEPIRPDVVRRDVYATSNAVSRAVRMTVRTARKRRLATAYATATRAPRRDPSRPYIYFPMHYQPEQTTAPEAGRWVMLDRIIERCLEGLPSDWTLLVRDHPFQLHPSLQGENGRSPRFYADAMKRDRRVAFAAIREDPFTLMDGARGVVTATGTSGWEALARGKPVLASGGAWYTGLPGTHCLDSDEQLAAFFASARGETSTPGTPIEHVIEALDRRRSALIPINFLSPRNEDRESPAVQALAAAIGRALA